MNQFQSQKLWIASSQQIILLIILRLHIFQEHEIAMLN